jgi:hypothetical protein
MIRPALLVTLLAAVMLGSGAVMLVRSKQSARPQAAAPPAADRLGRAEDLVRVAVPFPAEAIERATGDRWIYDAPDNAWPVDPRRVTELLGAIDSVLLSGPDADAPPIGEHPIALDLTFPGSRTARLEVARSPVAGLLPAAIAGVPVAAVPASIHPTLLDAATFADWRTTDLLPGLDAQRLGRIAIERGDDTIELGRLEGRWRMTRPVPARADDAVVASLVDRLAALEVASFVDDPAERPEGPARVSVQLSTRGPGDAAPRTLRLWDDPARGGTIAHASAPAPAWVRLDGSVPASISTAARNYLDPVPTDVRPEDVSIVRLVYHDGAELGFRRDLGAWTTMPDAEPADAEPIDELLRFLTEEPSEPQVASDGSGLRPLVRIELHDYTAEPLDILSAGYTADGAFAVHATSVLYLSGRWRGPELLGLPPFESLPAPAPAHATAEPEPVDPK